MEKQEAQQARPVRSVRAASKPILTAQPALSATTANPKVVRGASRAKILAAMGKKSSKFLQVPEVSTRRTTRTRQRELEEAARKTAEAASTAIASEGEAMEVNEADATSPSPAKPPRRRTRNAAKVEKVVAEEVAPAKPRRGTKGNDAAATTTSKSKAKAKAKAKKKTSRGRKRSFVDAIDIANVDAGSPDKAPPSPVSTAAEDKENAASAAPPTSSKKKRKLFKKGVRNSGSFENPEDAPTPSRLKKGLSKFSLGVGKMLRPRRKKGTAL